MRVRLQQVLEGETLTALYQPIVDLRHGRILGYEGLIRGPSDSPLHSPHALFKTARLNGMTMRLESVCRKVVLRQFQALGLAGNIFLNVSPEALLQPRGMADAAPADVGALSGIDPERVVIELTENEPAYDYELLRGAAAHYRSMGLRIAIDDLGEGFSSLRLWSELRPEYVKIDMHFIQGIDRDPVKLQFVRSIQEIARESGSHVIAEGVETQAELLAVRDIGIAYAQGYYLGRPGAQPSPVLPPDVLTALRHRRDAAWLRGETDRRTGPTARKILLDVPTVAATTPNNDVYELLLAHPALHVLPVLDGDAPVGLINRFRIIDRFARPFQRELFGRKPCAHFIDAAPLLVDHRTSLRYLLHLIAEADPQHLSNGFIITENGRYAGVGTGHDLMREITAMQIHAARYANPLTQLPGSVPINEHIDRLLADEERFAVCYCDLDNFKPFNDLYGYRKGDEIIQIAANLLQDHCDRDRDFVGHVGGDDFIVVFGSADWEERCRALLAAFPPATAHCFSASHRAHAGYETEDRRGKKVFHPLVGMSNGAVRVDPVHFHSSHQVSAAAADAKTQAKKTAGNSLFIERRQPGATMDAAATR